MPVTYNPKDEELIWAYSLEGFCLWSLDFMGLGRSTGHRKYREADRKRSGEGYSKGAMSSDLRPEARPLFLRLSEIPQTVPVAVLLT